MHHADAHLRESQGRKATGLRLALQVMVAGLPVNVQEGTFCCFLI